MGIICAIFTLGGLGLLASGEVLIGLLALALFGVGGAFFIIRNSRGAVTYRLTPQGIVPGSGGFVPWHLTGRIGPASPGGARAVGIEVLDIPGYVSTLTPEQQRLTMRAASFGRAAGPMVESPELASIPTGDLVSAVNWAAQNSGGYHLTFPQLSLNKSIPAAIQEIEAYRAAALGQQPPMPGRFN